MSEVYKNYEIEKADRFSFYQATNLNDCDAYMKHAKSIEEIKTEIDEDDKNENKLGMCNCCGDNNCHDAFCKG